MYKPHPVGPNNIMLLFSNSVFSNDEVILISSWLFLVLSICGIPNTWLLEKCSKTKFTSTICFIYTIFKKSKWYI